MREIKFRATNPGEGNKPYPVKSLEWNSEGDIIAIHVDDGTLSGKKWRIVLAISLDQSTGLKDCNGKEIYEGDIIELTQEDRKLFDAAQSDGNGVRKHCLVGYKHGSAMFGRHVLAAPAEMNSYLWLVEDKCEVVGNVYENWELLNATNTK